MSRVEWWGESRTSVLRRRDARRVVSIVVTAAFVAAAGLMPALEAQAASGSAKTIGSAGVSVPVSPVPVKNIPVSTQSSHNAKTTEVTWPAAASATVTLAAPSAGATSSATHATATKPGALGAVSQVSGSPVWLQPVADSKGSYTGPSSAQVKVLDHSKSAAMGISGEVFTVSGTSPSAGRVKVGLNYQAFAQEYGGNFGSRLSLVELPACALTTPQIASCRAQTPLSSTNQAVAQQITATVALGGSSATATAKSDADSKSAATPAAQTLVIAADSQPGTGGAAGGNYAATSLKPSESWNEGGDSGSYDYTYPITLPGSSSSLTPTASLSYSSQSVDGQTPTTNAQSSWVGDGWDTPDSFIEQSFATCSDNPDGLATAPTNADACYDGPILTLSLDGSSTSLVCTTDESSCTEQSDDGAVVKHVTDSGNGTNTYNTDYWTVTDRDGDTYYFGLNELPGYVSGGTDPTTNSVDYEPVYSEKLGEPCYNSAGLSSSVCTMAYRWHLDYVTNPTGQAMSYYYTQSTNQYGEFNGAHDVSYIRDSYLSEIDYGFNAGGAYGTVPDKVKFTPSTNDRCVQSSCTALSSSSMTASIAGTDDPDVPFDLLCGAPYAETTCTAYSPSFFSTNALSTIETSQYSAAQSKYLPVDEYTLAQTEPTTGDTTNQTLWLESIQHEGLDTSAEASGSGIAVPVVTFAGVDLANRVDDSNYPALYRWRMYQITSELGAVTTISYSTPDTCSAAYVEGETAAGAETNTDSCFPVYWTPVSTQVLDWFNSYAVSQVIVADHTGGARSEETDYSYGGGAAWHYDDNEVVKAKYRTYGQFRGYSTVTTTTGQATNDPQTKSITSYYRGMDGNWSIASGGTVATTVTDSTGASHTDSAALAGEVLESRSYLGNGGPLESDQITSYWVSSPLQTRTRTSLPALNAQMIGTAEVWKSQTDSDNGETGVSTVTETDTTYDTSTTDGEYGLPTYSYTHTVPTNTAYDSCTTTQYAPANTAANIVGLVSYTETDQVACAGFTEGSPSNLPAGFNTLRAPSSVPAAKVGSATETFYDDTSFATTYPQITAPAKGLVTMLRQAVSGTPGSFTWQTEKRDTYDSYGRVANAYDADGNETATSYTVNSVGLTTGQSTAAPATTYVNSAGTTVTTQHTTSETFDPTRNLTLTSTDANGIVTTETYDALGRLTEVWEHGRSTSLSPTVEYAYTLPDPTKSITLSGVTTQTLNDAGAYNTSVTIDDSLGRVRQTQTPTPQGGRLIDDTFYDSNGNVYQTYTNYWDKTTTPTMALDTADDENLVPDEDQYVYDGLGRQVEDISKNLAITVTTAVTVYNGDESTTFPPISGTLGTTVAPPYDGTVKTTATDPLGRASKLIEYTADPTLTIPSNTTTGVFKISGGTTDTTTYGYDAAGTLDQTTDNAGDVWSQTYNLLGQETSSTDPDAGASSMSYDPDGNLLQTVNADGKPTSYTYDQLGRKTAEYAALTSSQTNYSSSTSPGNETASWVYDNANAVSAVTDANGQATTQTSYAGGYAYIEQSAGYNNFGESLGTSITIPASQSSSIAKTWKFTSTYTATTGLLFSTTYPLGGGLPLETTNPSYTPGLYLPSGLAGTIDGYGQGTSYTAYGQVWSDSIGNGTPADDGSVTYAYDPHTGEETDQLVASGNPASNVDETAYTYDADGLTTGETDTRLGASTTAERQCFTYTTQDQLSQAWTTTAANCSTIPTGNSHTTVGDNLSSASAYDEAWTYNSAGDQAAETQYSTLTGQTKSTTNTYNGNAVTTGDSQPTTLTGTSTVTSGATGATTTAYGYNAEGQQTTRTTGTGDQSLTWNNQGQLIAVGNTTSSTDSSYIYDASGNLLIEADGANTTLYLPNEQITVNSSGTVVSSDRYYTLPGGITVVRTGATTNYNFEISSDQHGTNNLYLNNDCQSPTWRQNDPYGNPRGTAQTWLDNRGFLNDPDDATTALTDVGARWYDSATGSFVSLDPVLETADPTQLGGYDYSGNDPVSSSDPTGDARSTPPPSGGGINCNVDGPWPVGSTCSTASGGGTTTGSTTSGTGTGSGNNTGNVGGGTQSPKTPKGYHWEQCTEFMAANGNGCTAGTYYLASNYVAPPPGIFDQMDAAFGFAGAAFFTAMAVIGGCNPGTDIVTFGVACSAVAGGITAAIIAGPGAAGDVVDSGDPLEEDEPVSSATGVGCGGKSFTPDTLVLTVTGAAVPISALKAGDKVKAHNTATGKNETQTVDSVLLNHDTDLYNLTVTTPHGKQVIHTTSSHPFWDVTTDTWVDAAKLHTGDRLETADGTTAIANGGSTPLASTGWMWDLTISNDHDFYVVAGSTAVLVHNDSCGVVGDPSTIADNLDDNTYFHYTDEDGYNKAMSGNGATLRANPAGKVFATQDLQSPAEAEQNLFIGNPAYAGKGDYVIAFQAPEGADFLPGEQPNEFINLGTVRVPTSNILYAGPNPF